MMKGNNEKEAVVAWLKVLAWPLPLGPKENYN
jgi:hypothetical protein